MTQADLVSTIGDVLTELDTELIAPELRNRPADWQQVYAMRKHLDDQQRLLVAATIHEDSPQFAVQADMIVAAANDLDGLIGDISRIDRVLQTVAQIAADLDQILGALV